MFYYDKNNNNMQQTKRMLCFAIINNVLLNLLYVWNLKEGLHVPGSDGHGTEARMLTGNYRIYHLAMSRHKIKLKLAD